MSEAAVAAAATSKPKEGKDKAKKVLGKATRKHKRKTSFKPYIFRLLHMKGAERKCASVRIKESTMTLLDTLVRANASRIIPVCSEALRMSKRTTVSRHIVDTAVMSTFTRDLGSNSYLFARARCNQFKASLQPEASAAKAVSE